MNEDWVGYQRRYALREINGGIQHHDSDEIGGGYSRRHHEYISSGTQATSKVFFSRKHYIIAGFWLCRGIITSCRNKRDNTYVDAGQCDLEIIEISNELEGMDTNNIPSIWVGWKDFERRRPLKIENASLMKIKEGTPCPEPEDWNRFPSIFLEC